MPSQDVRTRYLSYAGLFSLLLTVVFFLVGVQERRYETSAARFKAQVVGKEIHHHRRYNVYGIRYRLTAAGQTVEREGDAGSRERWEAIRVGDWVDIEHVGSEENETRLVEERLAGSTVYYGLSAALAAGGVVLLVLRVRKAFR